MNRLIDSFTFTNWKGSLSYWTCEGREGRSRRVEDFREVLRVTDRDMERLLLAEPTAATAEKSGGPANEESTTEDERCSKDVASGWRVRGSRVIVIGCAHVAKIKLSYHQQALAHAAKWIRSWLVRSAECWICRHLIKRKRSTVVPWLYRVRWSTSIEMDSVSWSRKKWFRVDETVDRIRWKDAEIIWFNVAML